MIVVAFYSLGTPYEDDASILRASLDRVGMAHHIEGFTSRGGWYENTAYKAEYLRAQREQHTGPMLYVDADAFVHQNCAEYFDNLDADFGAHFFAGPAGGHNRRDVCACVRGKPCTKEHRLLSGTLFFGDTDGARKLLRNWCLLNIAKRANGDRTGGGQRNLWEEWSHFDRDGAIRTARLPGRYCYVFDKKFAYPKGEPCIIEHTIASRDHRPHNDGSAKTGANVARAARKLQLAKLVSR